MKSLFAKEFKPSDVWVLPYWKGPEPAAKLPFEIREALGDFQGKNGETLLVYHRNQRALLLGLGEKEKATVEALRRAYASATLFVISKKHSRMDLLFPDCKQKDSFFLGMSEGVFLSNYSFSYKSEEKKSLLKEVCFVGIEKKEALQEVQTVAEGVYFVRDLVNANADGKLEMLLEKAKALSPKVSLQLLDKKRLEKEGMDLLLAVNRGSHFDPFMAHLSYNGNPKSKEKVVLIGKGVLYDTGGLSLKPTDNMMTMKCDMAGAATVLGTIKTAAELELKINVDVLLPLTENSIDAKSYKIGDVYSSYSKKTVEITNTDAEGRLILADAIAYAEKTLSPSMIIDLATLTGACVVALGEDISALFSNDEGLAQELLDAADAVDEPLWQLPLYDDYFESLKSETADMVNSSGRDAGAIKAALFLKAFVKKVPWAHIDIAGPAYLTKPKHYHPLKGTGYGLRFLIQFLKGFSA